MKWSRRRRALLRAAWEEANDRAGLYASYPHIDEDVEFYQQKIRSCIWLELLNQGWWPHDYNRLPLQDIANRALKRAMKARKARNV